MFKKLNQLFCAHIYDLYIGDHDNPAKKVHSGVGFAGFGLGSVKIKGPTHIGGTHAKCCVCEKVILFVSVKFNP